MPRLTNSAVTRSSCGKKFISFGPTAEPSVLERFWLIWNYVGGNVKINHHCCCSAFWSFASAYRTEDDETLTNLLLTEAEGLRLIGRPRAAADLLNILRALPWGHSPDLDARRILTLARALVSIGILGRGEWLAAKAFHMYRRVPTGIAGALVVLINASTVAGHDCRHLDPPIWMRLIGVFKSFVAGIRY
jgi:hypothetical protein